MNKKNTVEEITDYIVTLNNLPRSQYRYKVLKALERLSAQAQDTARREEREKIEGLRKDTRVSDSCIIDDCPCPDSMNAQGYNNALDDVLKELGLQESKK